MADEKYNGWTNYETWNLGLILSNTEALYSMCREWAQSLTKVSWEDGDNFKEWLESLFFREKENVVIIDCETWDSRSWAEINFKEVLESFMEEGG